MFLLRGNWTRSIARGGALVVASCAEEALAFEGAIRVVSPSAADITPSLSAVLE